MNKDDPVKTKLNVRPSSASAGQKFIGVASQNLKELFAKNRNSVSTQVKTDPGTG
jgi:hypothetical protein